MAQRCRACGAPLIWARHAATRKLAPLDARPNRYRGNIMLDTTERTYTILSRGEVAALATEDRVRLRTSHYATCPDAAAFRRRS